MHIEQIYTACLAEAAYYVESDGEAIIIDPLREVQPYIDMAQERGAQIKYVFETHFHADFVSGHIDLSRLTGAPIVYGPNADAKFDAINAEDGQEFKVGKLTIRVLYTPGHTPCSSCFLLLDEHHREYALFSGDTLFVGDVGRPDLLSDIISKEVLAGQMFDSLNEKIKTLPDHVIVYPGHGAGSQCGKNLGKETQSTIGEQKRSNYALLIEDRDVFIQQITEGLQAPPKYFPQDAQINKNGYAPLTEVMEKNLRALMYDSFKTEMDNGALVLDTRKADDFEKSFIPGSINIGLNGQFAVWVGTLIDIHQPLLLIADPGQEEEAILRLARVGYENILGYLDQAMKGWQGETDTIKTINAEEMKEQRSENCAILDVRQRGEWTNGHLEDAQFLPLSEMPSNLEEMDINGKYLIYCGGGYRSMTAASMMKRVGFRQVLNIRGGMSAIQSAGIPLVEEAHA